MSHEKTTSDSRIFSIVSIPSPETLQKSLPLNTHAAIGIVENRHRIANILHGRDKRLLLVVGPCSIHDPDAAREYANKLLALRNEYIDSLEIVMRVYFEKPRTTGGWKGLINDPALDDSCDIEQGLYLARQLLLDIANIGMPAGCEFLDAATGQYYADLVSWGAIGARTSESQIHRELASGLSCPVGFKNGTKGNIDIAVDGMRAAALAHSFLSPDSSGKLSMYSTKGNSDTHLILRGGDVPNFDTTSVINAKLTQNKYGLNQRVLVDCSHANSRKDYRLQPAIVRSIKLRLENEIENIGGLMIESNLVEGKQSINAGKNLIYGKSITDGCIGFDETQTLIEQLGTTMRSVLARKPNK